jgi:NitT/TauT family transport system substrate-binding protein
LVASGRSLAADRLETTSVRLVKFPGVCLAPQYVAEALLRAEGFTNIGYVDLPSSAEFAGVVAEGKADFTMDFAARLVLTIDEGGPISVLGGVHVGCFELFGGDHIRTISDLKGKSVGVHLLGRPHAFLGAAAAHIGIDPKQDIRWVTELKPDPLELFAAGKLDAFLGTPPEPQMLRARKVGHVIASSIIDPPWSQYFCCMLAGNRDYVRRNPIATKGVLRAILKAADFCTSEPVRAARQIVDRGFVDQYDYVLQTLREIPYDKWREYDPEDTLRFYALRLYEAGLVKSSPNRIIANAADWRFLNELRRELKT